MYGRHAAGQVLVALAGDHEAGVELHVAELGLARVPLDALLQVLVAVAVGGDELADEGDGAEGPLLVERVEERVPVRLADLEAGEDAAGLEHAVRLAQ